MNYRVAATFIGLFFVSCVYFPTQRSPFSEAITQFTSSKTTGTEVAEIIRPYSATLDTFNEHKYGVYQWKGQVLFVAPLVPFIAPFACMSPSPIGKGRSPVDQFMLIELDDNDLLVRHEVVTKNVPLRYLATLELRTEYRKRLLSETWSIPSADLTVDIDPYQKYWQDIHKPDAKRWLCEAADQHNPEALYRLGVLYENGSEGLPKNIEMAYFWYRFGATAKVQWWLTTPAPQTSHWSDLAAKRIEWELSAKKRANVEKKIRVWSSGECVQLLVPENSPR
jgi:hypothetical protein